MQAPETPLYDHIMNVEVRAARIEGILAADPGLGQTWRAMIALTEACKSVSLEDIHVFEGDVISRSFENRAVEIEEVRGTDMARLAHRCLARSDMVSQGRLHEIFALMGHSSWRGATAPAAQLTALSRVVETIVRSGGSPFRMSLAAALATREATGGHLPMMERLVFMMADSHCRSQSSPPFTADTVKLRNHILQPVRSHWVLTPAIGLTQSGHRSWSPDTPGGLRNLIEGLAASLDVSIGLVPVLRRWRTDADSFASRKIRSSLMIPFVKMLGAMPIVDTASIAAHLGCTDRSALNLVNEACANGLLTQITGRMTYRVWAVPPLAKLLRMRTVKDSLQADRAPQDTHEVHLQQDAIHTANRSDDGFADRAAAALQKIDSAMDELDRVLSRQAARRSDDGQGTQILP